MSFIDELKRRNVVRMAVLYAVASWLILQVADVLFDALELPPTSVRLVLAVLILGFPLTLIVSWVYEMTPEGLKREKDIDRNNSVTEAAGRKINVLIVVLLILAIIAVTVDRLIPESPILADTPAIDASENPALANSEQVADEILDSDRSVAVLPFANRSALDDDIFFVDGIHDDILTQLARIGSLTVISRTSVERFRDTSQSMKEIGAALDVKTVLEGGVQRAGDRVRINVQLIDVATDDHLWADTYDRELTTANIFAIQSEISTAIAEALKAALSPEEEKQLDAIPTENLEALEAYFLGRQSMALRTSASLARSEQQFKRAIELDSEYALAHIGLADTYQLQTAYSSRPKTEQEKLAIPLIEKALAINDRLGEAYISKTKVTSDLETQEVLLRKGIALTPSYAQGYHWYGDFLFRTGRSQEALVQLKKAARLDPLSSIIKATIGEALEALGRFDAAREQYEAIVRVDPDFAIGPAVVGELDWYAYARLDDAMQGMRQAFAIDSGRPIYPANIALLWSDLGDTAEAARWLERTRVIAGGGFWGHIAAMWISLSRGDVADAAANAAELIADAPAHAHALWVLGLNDLREGHADAAVERYRAAYPALLDDADAIIDGPNYKAAVHLAYFLRSAGNDALAKGLLDRSLAYVQTIPRLGGSGSRIADVRIFAMQGRNDQALAALRHAVDEGWRFLWRVYLKYDPVLAVLHDAPEFKVIISDLEVEMATQLEHVREMEVNGVFALIPE